MTSCHPVMFQVAAAVPTTQTQRRSLLPTVTPGSLGQKTLSFRLCDNLVFYFTDQPLGATRVLAARVIVFGSLPQPVLMHVFSALETVDRHSHVASSQTLLADISNSVMLSYLVFP